MNEDTKSWVYVGIYVAVWIGLRALIYQTQKNINSAYGNTHRTFYQRRSNQSNMTWEMAAKALKVNLKKLKKMSKAEIKKIYRERAKAVHPDVGGSAADFNNVNAAYKFAAA